MKLRLKSEAPNNKTKEKILDDSRQNSPIRLLRNQLGQRERALWPGGAEGGPAADLRGALSHTPHLYAGDVNFTREDEVSPPTGKYRKLNPHCKLFNWLSNVVPPGLGAVLSF